MNETLPIICKLLVAIILGGIIGFEREFVGKPAGSRTYALVSLGTALFTVMSLQGFRDFLTVDPTRMTGQVLVGIGFIGAGLIVFHKNRVEGLTTAAALWTTAAIGMAVGIGWYAIAIISTIFVFIILNVLGRFDFTKKQTTWEKLTHKRKKKSLF